MERILFINFSWTAFINSKGLTVLDNGNGATTSVLKTAQDYSDWLMAFEDVKGNSKELKKLAFSFMYPSYVQLGIES